MRAPLAKDEEKRVAALRSYEILDTPQEESFDEIANLAANICETPIALITFVDADRQWFKAKVGLALSETTRDHAFCAHAILSPDEVLVVPDALLDTRFSDNPLVLSAPYIRFYAGAPLVTIDGAALGSICVIDHVPRELTAEQIGELRALALDIVTELDLRRNLKLLSKAVNVERSHEGELIHVQQVLQRQALKRMAELREAYQDLLAINRIVTACTQSLDLETILERVLDVSLGVTGLDGGTICLLAQDQTLHLTASRGATEETIVDLTTHQIKIGDCLCGNSARDLKPLILSDRDAVLEYSSREAQRREQIFFHAAYPFVTAAKCVGVLCLFARSEMKPSQRSLRLVETITAQVALAIENSRLFQETTKHAMDLEQKISERTVELEHKNLELERINRLFVGRELRMRELKQRIAKLQNPGGLKAGGNEGVGGTED